MSNSYDWKHELDKQNARRLALDVAAHAGVDDRVADRMMAAVGVGECNDAPSEAECVAFDAANIPDRFDGGPL